MSVDIRSSDKKRYIHELQAREKEIAAGLLKSSEPSSPKVVQESEKRIRREIANGNERRRMQCINAGFSSLRALIPLLEGEKLSKAAILQNATDYITSLEKDKSRLQSQLDQTRGLLSELGQDRAVTDAYVSSSPPPSKRKKRDTESSDEGVCSLSDASDDGGSELQQEIVALRHQVEVERQRCATLEEHNRIIEAQLVALLHVQLPHSRSLNELHSATLEHRQLQQDPTYNREIIEIIVAHEPHVVPSRFDNFQQPVSPTSERVLSRQMSFPLDATNHRSPVVDSSRAYARGSVSPKLKTGTHEDEPSSIAAAPQVSSEAVTSAALPANEPQRYFCNRDPRRRHRYQAQLEQQREEELTRQKHERTVIEPPQTQQKRNTQNLEKLVEAIRQIEGDRMLCKSFDDDHTMFEKHQNIRNAEESERDNSGVSDHDDPKSENSGRESPFKHRLHSHQQRNITTDKRDVANNSSSTFSEKYPLASHLLHRPIHPSFFRPGVIVHKQ